MINKWSINKLDRELILYKEDEVTAQSIIKLDFDFSSSYIEGNGLPELLIALMQLMIQGGK